MNNQQEFNAGLLRTIDMLCESEKRQQKINRQLVDFIQQISKHFDFKLESKIGEILLPGHN
jgi:hypothetical protein